MNETHISTFIFHHKLILVSTQSHIQFSQDYLTHLQQTARPKTASWLIIRAVI